MRALFGPTLKPRSSAPAPRDLPLEGLRGLCALAVFYAHLFIPARAIDPAWAPPAQFWWFNLGAPAVLMFFVLSGYVIGLVTTQPPTNGNVRTYLVHRAARLTPLNTIAVLVSCLLLPSVDGRTFVGNLLFLENAEPYPWLGHFPPLFNNTNLWSLNFEAVYYLGFIAVWRFAPPTLVVFGLMVVVVVAHSVGLPIPAIFARYACGALYWLAGLAIAWHATPVASEPRRTNWPAAMLAFYAMWQVGPLRALLYAWNLPGWLWISTTSPHRIDMLLASVWLLLAVTGRAPRLCRALTWSCLGWVTAGLVTRLVSDEWAAANTAAALAVAIAWLLARREFSLSALRACAPLGAISFALYIIAGPLQFGQRSVAPGFSGTWFTFTVRALLLTAVTLAFSWLLERRLGPQFSRWIRRAAGNATRGRQPQAVSGR